MSTTIKLGKSGRLVIPKAIRESLELREGSRLKLSIHSGKIEAIPEADFVPVIIEDGIPVFQTAHKVSANEMIDVINTQRNDREERVSEHSHNKAK